MTARITPNKNWTHIDYEAILLAAGGSGHYDDITVKASGDVVFKGVEQSAIDTAVAAHDSEAVKQAEQDRKKQEAISEIETAVDEPLKESVRARRLLYDVQLDMVNEAVDSFNEVFQALGLQKRLDHYTRDDVTARVKEKARQQ